MKPSPAAHPMHGASGGHRRVTRLRLVVQQSFELGAKGVHAPDAMDARDDAIYADGALPAHTPSQQRAWRVTTHLADQARHEGARIAVRRDADAAVAEFGGSMYDVLYATAYRAARYVWSDADIVDAVSAALVAAGHECEFGTASPMFPIRRARAAQAVDDDRELASFHLERRGSPAERAAFLADLNDAAGSRVAAMVS